MSTTKRRRLMDVIRRATGAQSAPRFALDDAELWDAREKAAQSAAEAGKLAERVTAGATRQRGQFDAAIERAALVSAKAEASGNAARRVVEALDRLGVVGLNAGLEGSRTAEGRALLFVAEEIRANVTRGTEAARDTIASADELREHATDLAGRLERSRQDSVEMGGDAALLKTAAQDASLALVDLEARLRKATGLDPEIARTLGQAGDHAKGLVMALTALESRGPDEVDRGAVLEALAPVLTPLQKLLAAATDGGLLAPLAKRDERGDG